MTKKWIAFVLALGGVAAGCADGAAGTGDAPTEIPAGTTLTLAPGAQLLAAKGATLIVRGVLVLPAGSGPHARIAPRGDGDTWGGLVVEAGGELHVSGLDLDGATTALEVETGAGPAVYADGTITRVETPFQVGRGASLEVSNAKVVAASSSSGIAGTFSASRLDYQKAGASGGLIMTDPNATFDVQDSRFSGTADAGGDYIISYGAKLVRVTYSTITGSHCAFHFDGLDRFEIDHVTAGAATPDGPRDLNVWGAMLYGSGAGPNVISHSNFVNQAFNLEQQGINGPLTITDTFTTGKNAPDSGWTWLDADVAAAPIADAQPR
jgi:hypothetical protein